MVEHQPHEEASEPNEPQASARANSRASSVTTSGQPPEDEKPAPDIERFFCLHCGYDLTGHSGERRRCPECGQFTSLDELKIALSVQKRGIAASEPAVRSSLLSLPLIFFGLPSVLIDFPNRWWVISVPCLVAWIWSTISFYFRYRHHYDWLWFLLESHALVLLLPTSTPFLLMFTIAFVVERDGVLLLVALIAAILLTVSILAYRGMKRRLPAYKLLGPPKIAAEE